MKTLIATTALIAGLITAPAAHACVYQCYDSGNTGIHCEYTNCDDN